MDSKYSQMHMPLIVIANCSLIIFPTMFSYILAGFLFSLPNPALAKSYTSKVMRVRQIRLRKICTHIKIC